MNRRLVAWKLYEFFAITELMGMVADYLSVWAKGWISGSWEVVFVMNNFGEGKTELLMLAIPIPWLFATFWKWVDVNVRP